VPGLAPVGAKNKLNRTQDFKMKLLLEFFLLTAVIITPIQAAIFFGCRYSIRGIRALVKILKARLAAKGEK
jgi:hypothetical protein